MSSLQGMELVFSFNFLLSRELVMTANVLYRMHHNKHAQYTDTNRDLTVNVIAMS